MNAVRKGMGRRDCSRFPASPTLLLQAKPAIHSRPETGGSCTKSARSDWCGGEIRLWRLVPLSCSERRFLRSRRSATGKRRT